MTFKLWLSQFQTHDNPIGDLADDVARDRSAPEENNYVAWRNHMSNRQACPGALRTLRAAWRRYEREVTTIDLPKMALH